MYKWQLILLVFHQSSTITSRLLSPGLQHCKSLKIVTNKNILPSSLGEEGEGGAGGGCMFHLQFKKWRRWLQYVPPKWQLPLHYLRQACSWFSTLCKLKISTTVEQFRMWHKKIRDFVIYTCYLLLFTYWNSWAHYRLDTGLEWEIQGIYAYTWCVNPQENSHLEDKVMIGR